MAKRLITDLVHPGDLFICQTRHKVFVIGKVKSIDEQATIGYDPIYWGDSLKDCIEKAKTKYQMERKWTIGYHRWKLEPIAQ